MKAGDIVVLKSGGPKMVISCVESHNMFATCNWIHDGCYQKANIPTSALAVWKDPDAVGGDVTIRFSYPQMQEVSVRSNLTIGDLVDILGEKTVSDTYFKFII